MSINPTLADHLLTVYRGVERRSKPRIREAFPATVHGVDASGEAFETNAVLDDISAGGLYVRLMQYVEPGTTLSIIVRLTGNPTNGITAPRVTLHGVVLRAELKPGGTCGVAVTFTHHRFL